MQEDHVPLLSMINLLAPPSAIENTNPNSFLNHFQMALRMRARDKMADYCEPRNSDSAEVTEIKVSSSKCALSPFSHAEMCTQIAKLELEERYMTDMTELRDTVDNLQAVVSSETLFLEFPFIARSL